MYYGTTNAYACTGDGMSHGLARRRAAQGHGVHAVPPDDAEVERRADHRGLPRRGRLPAQLERRALHGRGRAERDGARLARRRLARGDAARSRTGRGVDGCVLLDLTHLGAEEDPHAGCRAPASSRWTTPASTRSSSRSRSGPAPTTTWAASTRTCTAQTIMPGLYAAGEVRLRLGARREPPRRQLADGDDHVRPPRRAGTPASDALDEPQRRARARGRACATPSAASARSSAAPAASGPGRCASELATVDVRQRRRLPHQRAPRALPGHGRASCASAGAASCVDDTRRPLQHRPRLGARAREHARDGRLPRHRRARARRSRAARTRASTTPSATTSAG